MQAKVGDTVRYLNAVGGGRIVRIEGQIAYVDEDGFETPVLIRECVVVASGDSFYKTESNKKTAKPEPTEIKVTPDVPVAAPTKVLPPAIETPEGEKLNILLVFEPNDIKRLSETSFDAFFINDSNFDMYVSVATRNNQAEKWHLRFAGMIEASIQEFVFELSREELPYVDRISVMAIPFKRSADYTLKEAVTFEQRLDTTKFARLHCFEPNDYFDSQVLTIPVVRDDKVVRPHRIEPETIQRAITEKQVDNHENRNRRQRISKPSRKTPDILEVDLHATELLDNLNGLGKADILNYQVDKFRKVMDENLRFPGRKIIFIHGKGEGILRQALIKELNHRYKGHDVSDASFREYGFGATQVIIRKV